MASKQAVLNGSASLLGGMTMAIARSAGTTIAAREGSSTSVSANEARYSPDYTLIFPPVSPVVHLASATTTRAWAGGTGSTVSSLVIARTGNGDGSNTLRFVNDSPATPVTLRSVSMAGNGTTKPVGADDLGALEADYLHKPVGVRIFRGISLFACEQWVYSGSGDRTDTANYLRRGVSLIQSQNDGQTFGLLWRGPAEASSEVTIPAATASTGFGSEWGFTVSAMRPDGSTERAVVSVFSYASGTGSNLRSSTSYHVTMERDSGLWIMSANATQLVHYAGTSTSGHSHTGHWIERDDGTCVFYGSDGDGSNDNRLIEVEVDSFGDICDGTTPVTGAYNVYEPGTGWGSIVEINGTKASASDGLTRRYRRPHERAVRLGRAVLAIRTLGPSVLRRLQR